MDNLLSGHTDGLNKLVTEAKLNGVTLQNRIVKAATFESMLAGYS